MDVAPGRLLDLLAEATTLAQLLPEICELAVEVVSECDGAGLTIIRDGGPATTASSDQRARRIDEAQYSTGEGPYLDAVRTDRPVLVDDLGDSSPGAPWRRVAREEGMTAALSVPVAASNEMAVLSLYTARTGGWSRSAATAAESFAVYAGEAIAIANRLSIHPATPPRDARSPADPMRVAF
jgi:GAF domain-containing protein